MKKGRIMYNYLSLKTDLANTDNGVPKVSLLTTKFTSWSINIRYLIYSTDGVRYICYSPRYITWVFLLLIIFINSTSNNSNIWDS